MATIWNVRNILSTRKWILTLAAISYALGAFNAFLNGNTVIHDAADVSLVKFTALKCNSKDQAGKNQINIRSEGALLWRSYPVMTLSTNVADNPVCFGAILTDVRTYRGRFEIEVIDPKSKKISLLVIKK